RRCARPASRMVKPSASSERRAKVIGFLLCKLTLRQSSLQMLLLQFCQPMPELSFPARRRNAARAGFCMAFAVAGMVLALPAGTAAQQAAPVFIPSDKDLSPHPSEQKPLSGDPESPGTPVLRPSDNDPSPGTQVLHPTDERLSVGTPVLLDAMTTELHRAFTSLGKQAPGK